jgi:septum site-determining protein MinD
MATKIYFSGGKGGVGTTTCSIFIGLALAESGARTLLFDGDMDCGQALNLCGMWGMHVYTLGDAERGNCRVKQTIIKHPHSHNFYVMPSIGIEREQFCEQAIAEVEGLFDYIICDKIALSICDRAIVVCEPYQLSLRCANRELGRLTDGGIKNLQIVLNKVNGGLVFDGEIMTPQEIATLLHTPLLGVVPEDLTLPLGKCKDETKKAFKIVAENLSGKSKKTLSVIKPYVGVSGLLKRKMRSKI